MALEREDIIGSFEQKKKAVAQFNLMDDTFFSVVLEDRAACEYLLKKLLGKDLHIIESKTQYSIRNIEEHSVILDLIAEDSEHNIYNIEIQTGYTFEPKRTRYHQSALDWSFLEKGGKYEDLPDTYIIFITDKDIFSLGRNRYETVQYIKDSDIEFKSGEHKLFFNTAVDDGTDLSELLQYFAHSDAENDNFGALSKAVRYHKTNAEGVETMCKLMEEFAEKCKAEGKLEDKLEIVQNMLSRGIDLEEALMLTGLEREVYEEYDNKE